MLSFLVVLVERHPGLEVGFKTTIYRELTFTGLITKWDSFVPKSYEHSAISSMVDRAIKICASYSALDAQFDFIRLLALNPSSESNSIYSMYLLWPHQ